MTAEQQHPKDVERQEPAKTTIAEDFDAVEVEAPILDSKNVDCWTLGSLYQSAASEAKASGNESAANVFALLVNVANIHFKPEDSRRALRSPVRLRWAANVDSQRPSGRAVHGHRRTRARHPQSRTPRTPRRHCLAKRSKTRVHGATRHRRLLRIPSNSSSTARANSSTKTGPRAATTAAGCCAARVRSRTQLGGRTRERLG